jgi:hypothetical protein
MRPRLTRTRLPNCDKADCRRATWGTVARKRFWRGTPSRDLRLLIAIDVVLGFADRVARRPERYAMPNDKSVAEVKGELQRVLAYELATRKFSYPRSDGSAWTLTLRDVIDRAVDLEMAYNPNDCVELRWGALAKSDEASTCKRYAPAAQREKMSKYRAWFHERRRPPRA